MESVDWDEPNDAMAMLLQLDRILPRVVSWQGPEVARPMAPQRKIILFRTAVARKVEPLLKHEWHRAVLDTTEEMADFEERTDPSRRWELNVREARIRCAINELWMESQMPSHTDYPEIDTIFRRLGPESLVWWERDLTPDSIAELLRLVASGLKKAWGNRRPPGPTDAELFGDIFGNPFRPVAFDRGWRTSTAVGVAQTMYDARDFAAMPILADALQDAGCEDDTILAHCRRDGPHVRGCWVVDLVLGKA